MNRLNTNTPVTPRPTFGHIGLFKPTVVNFAHNHFAELINDYGDEVVDALLDVVPYAYQNGGAIDRLLDDYNHIFSNGHIGDLNELMSVLREKLDDALHKWVLWHKILPAFKPGDAVIYRGIEFVVDKWDYRTDTYNLRGYGDDENAGSMVVANAEDVVKLDKKMRKKIYRDTVGDEFVASLAIRSAALGVASPLDYGYKSYHEMFMAICGDTPPSSLPYRLLTDIGGVGNLQAVAIRIQDKRSTIMSTLRGIAECGDVTTLLEYAKI